MNVLLVDDDRFVIEALKQKINWKGLGINKIFSASNIFSAKKIFEQHQVHILISDIEMPRGTGLELLAWIRSEGFDVQAIFLTNYASFNYAQKAIELQSIEYFLKPVEFEKFELVIKKAVNKVKSRLLEKEVITVGKHWHRYKEKIVESFWKDYINSAGSITIENLQEMIKEKNLQYSVEDRFIPILIKLFPYSITEHVEIKIFLSKSARIKEQLKKLIQNICKGSSFHLESLIEMKKNEDYLAIFKVIGNDSKINNQDIAVFGNKLIFQVNDRFQCDIQCIVHGKETLSRFQVKIIQMLTFDEELIHFRNQTIEYNPFNEHRTKYVEPNLQLFEYYLQSGNREGFIDKCRQYLENFMDKKSINYHVLCNFRLDITQLIFTHLKSKRILAHHLFHGKVNDFLLEKSTRSIEDLMSYISYLVHLSLNYMEFTNSRKSVVKKICDYIDGHYHENLTRNDLAEIVYLSPDYIARLFKKETGMSLIDYITDKRIKIAKDLLKHTDLPIHVISEKVGYENYSYFTKLFKKVTKKTPRDYRRKSATAEKIH